MQSNPLVKQATGVSAFLLVGFAIAYSLVEMQIEMMIFLGLWAILVLTFLIKINVISKPQFPSVMYLLVMTTFLNQSVLNIHVGFFSLFLYRLVLIAAVTLFFVHVIKERNLPQIWNQVNVKGVLLFLLFWMAYGAVSLLWAKLVIEGIKSLILLGMGISFVFLAVFTFQENDQLVPVFWNLDVYDSHFNGDWINQSFSTYSTAYVDIVWCPRV